MTYEIWGGASGNLLVTRPTNIEALMVVREAIANHGEEYVDSLALLFEDEAGESMLIAEGPELAAMSRRPAPHAVETGKKQAV
jgi:hypothetical protein